MNFKPWTTKKIILTTLIVFAGIAIFINIFAFKNTPPSEPAKPFVVVLPFTDVPPDRPGGAGFVNKMQDLGYKEGIDIIYKQPEFIAPSPDGFERIKDLYRSFITENVDLFVTGDFGDTNAAFKVTQEMGSTIPIVFTDVSNVIELGLAKSWASSGNNLAGITEERDESIEKALNLFMRIVPGIKKIGIAGKGFMLPAEPSITYHDALLKQAKKLGIEIVEYSLDFPPGPGYREKVVDFFENIKKGEVDAWVHIPGHPFGNQHAFEHKMAIRNKIPYMMPAIEFDQVGDVEEAGSVVGFFTYGADFYKKGQQAATIADKILRGGMNPSDIPLERPYKYDIMINLKVAKAIGVTVPQDILDIADMIIE